MEEELYAESVNCSPVAAQVSGEEQEAEPDIAKVPRVYPSLYDSISTTFGAVAIGIVIVALVQILIAKVTQKAKTDHMYLTRFVTTLVAIVVGVYIADLLIAGPDTSLLSDSEHDVILHFIKDTCLMVFSYYFGLKAQTPQNEPTET
jgi:hypothetical protein